MAKIAAARADAIPMAPDGWSAPDSSRRPRRCGDRNREASVLGFRQSLPFTQLVEVRLRGRRRTRATVCSAWRRRCVDQLGVDRLEALGPSQGAEIDRPIGKLLLLRPSAEAAEILVVDLVDRHRPYVGVPLFAGRLLAQIELGLAVGGDRGGILLGDRVALDGRAQPARRGVAALR